MYFDEILKAYHIEKEETVIKIPFENIQKISKGYLFYKNCDGVTENINLDDCVRNFNISIGKEMRNQSGKIIRVVGCRCFSRPIAFYEFFTNEHHVRFFMNTKQSAFKRFLSRIGLRVDTKTFSGFYSLQERLISFGYSAIDLT